MYTVGDKAYCSAGWYTSADSSGTPVIAFYDPTVGFTTPGSANPRVELRELTASSALASWSLVDGSTNTMSVVQSVQHVAAVRQSVSFFQIHQTFDPGYGAFVEVQTRLSKTKYGTLGIYIIWFGPTGAEQIIPLVSSYTLGTKYTLTVVASSTGGVSAINFTYTEWGSSQSYSRLVSCGCNLSDVYFKAGTYGQHASDEASNDYHLAYLYSTFVMHPSHRVLRSHGWLHDAWQRKSSCGTPRVDS